MAMQGETKPTITDEEMTALRTWIRATMLPLQTAKDRVTAIKLGLKAAGLPKRHSRHAVTIAESVFEKSSNLLDLTGGLMLKFSRYFRFLEHTWNHSSDIKSRRAYFLNYKFLIEKMCQKWNVDCRHIVSIKSKGLRRQQEVNFDDLIRAAITLRGQVKNTKLTYDF